MSNLKDFNKILNDFENEIKNLKDIAGAYNKLQKLIQLQIELSSKIDSNIQSVNNIVEKQNDLDLAKQLESLDILSEHIDILTDKVGKDMETRFSEIINIINTTNNELKGITEKHSKQYRQNIETLVTKKLDLVLSSLKEKNKELISKLETSYNSTLYGINNNKEMLDSLNTKLSSKLEELIETINKNQNEIKSSLLDRLNSVKDDINTEIRSSLDGIKYDIKTEIKIIEKNLMKEQKSLADKNTSIKIILIITLLASISANIIHFIK